jgi:predicted pyridoxine 5'-phosphate oxidase superfamily flavin-nucleotide-binding protein
MAKLTEAMKKFVADQRLGFLATVNPDGLPNVSPKGLTFIFDETRIVIGEIRSPETIKNLRFQPIAELNVVDQFSRKGFRFSGPCTIHRKGSEFEQFERFLQSKGAQSAIRSVIIMTVDRILPISSPVYDRGVPETEVRDGWVRHYQTLDPGNPGK